MQLEKKFHLYSRSIHRQQRGSFEIMLGLRNHTRTAAYNRRPGAHRESSQGPSARQVFIPTHRLQDLSLISGRMLNFRKLAVGSDDGNSQV